MNAIEISSRLNGLVIFSSAMLAISKHLGDQHRSLVEENKMLVRNASIRSDETNDALQKLKKDKDNLLNTSPWAMKRPIFGLFCGLLTVPVLHILSILWSRFSDFSGWFFVGVFGMLGVLSLWVVWHLYKMDELAKKIERDAKSILSMYEVLVEAVECERRNTNSTQ